MNDRYGRYDRESSGSRKWTGSAKRMSWGKTVEEEGEEGKTDGDVRWEKDEDKIPRK